MKDFWIKNRKLIMIIVASLLLVMNISIILFSKISQDMRKSVSEIFGESKILDINFCAGNDFFKNNPGNTVKCVVEAVDNNFDSVLLDVRFTSDGKAVCCKDENLLKITGKDVNVKDITYFNLIADNIIFKNKKTSFFIERSEDVINACVENGITPIIFFHTDVYSDKIGEIIKPYEFKDAVVVMSENYEFLRKIKTEFPSIKLWYKTDEVSAEKLDSMNLLGDCEIIFNCQNHKNNSKTVEMILSKKREFGCYGADKKSLLKKCVRFGAHDVITNKFVK